MDARARLLAAATTLALALAPAPATAAPGLPYKLEIDGAALVASPTHGASMLAVQVEQVGTSVRFTPAAVTFPDGGGQCTSTAAVTTCDEALVASELRLQGPVLGVVARAVATPKLAIVGGAENDEISVTGPAAPGLTGLVELTPGAGDDTISIAGEVGDVDLVGADGGNDRYTITSENASISGTLALGAGNDVASSAAENLTLDGGAGDDTLIGPGELVGGPGSDVVKPTSTTQPADGGDDLDRLSFDQQPGPLTLSRDAGNVKLGALTYPGFEQLEGSVGDDTMIGTTGAEVFDGGEGDDTIEGRGGSDSLAGGPGANTVSYANESTPITLDLGAGTAVSALGSDLLSGFSRVLTGAGSDVVTGTPAHEHFDLGAGNDTVVAGDGNDVVLGGPGNDSILAGRGSDGVDGGPGVDTVSYVDRGASEPVSVNLGVVGGHGAAGENDGIVGVENAFGGASSDTLVGDAGDNVLLGGAGLNTLSGLAGNDVIHGGPQRDVISGGAGFDQLFGGDDDDSIDAFDSGPDVVDCGPSPDDDAQVDAADAVANCEYSRRGDVPIPVDADGDGFVAGFDCDDSDPALRPGATDIVGDGIDQDCDGFDQPVPYVDYAVARKFTDAGRRGKRIRRLTVTKLASDERVQVTCKTTKRYSKRCPFTRRTRKPNRAGSAALASLFRNRPMPPGTRIELRITAPDKHGRVRRYTIRSAGSTREQRLCLRQGTKAPRRCPSGDEE